MLYNLFVKIRYLKILFFIRKSVLLKKELAFNKDELDTITFWKTFWVGRIS